MFISQHSENLRPQAAQNIGWSQRQQQMNERSSLDSHVVGGDAKGWGEVRLTNSICSMSRNHISLNEIIRK